MFFACTHPELIDKLIIADMAPKRYANENQNVINTIDSIDLKQYTSRKEVEGQLRKMLADNATVQFLLKNLKWKENDSQSTGEQLSWKFNFAAIKKNADALNEALPETFRFNGQTLFLKGQRSTYITDSDYELIKKHFLKTIIETIPDAGHWVHAENPSVFTRAVIQFLNP